MTGDKLRFLVAGVANTGLTYVVYLALLAAAPYRVAYTGSYAAGIVLSYALNTFYVFREPWSWKKLAAFPLVYVVQYLVGLVVVSLLVEVAGVPTTIAPLAAVLITLPTTYLASRAIIKARPNESIR